MGGKGRKRMLLTNPITIVLPIVVILIAGWRIYTEQARNVSVPVNTNLLPTGSFDDLESNGMPKGWVISTDGSLSYSVNKAKGYEGGSSLSLQISQYVNGDLTLSSPVIPVSNNQTYLFKGYYTASDTFELLVRKYFQDGSSQLQLLRSYPRTAPGAWTTVSDAFNAGSELVGVQYIYHVTSNDLLLLDGTYFEQSTDVNLSDPPESNNNLIPNGSLSTGTGSPALWLTYASGKNKPKFTYVNKGGGAYVSVSTADYKKGEAKWQYRPQKVSPYQRYWFSVDYMSDTKTNVIVEYVLKNGKHQFNTLTTLNSASQWTTVSQTFDTPPNAATMFVSVVLQSNGTVSTRDYQLHNITKHGVTHWNRPLVSLTFDDGWESVYANALPILAKFGYKGTFYINPTTIETNKFMTGAQLQSLDDGEDEIASEGFNRFDMTTLSVSALDYQLRKAQDYLAQAGLKTKDFAAPYGKTDAQVSWYARKYYNVMRSTENGINTAQNFDPYNLRVLYVGGNTTPNTIRQAIQNTKSNDGWLILVYHQIGDNPAPNDGTTANQSPNTSTQDFINQMQAIADGGIKVVTVEQAYQQIHSQ
jgi:peptidoglycan/xylan/chitin deacetylase (PgdA/CDA1 family)